MDVTMGDKLQSHGLLKLSVKVTNYLFVCIAITLDS